MHQGQLAGVIELEAGNTLAAWQNSRFGKLSELPAINKRFQNVLLYVVIAVNNACHLLAKLRKIFNGLSNAVVSDIVGGRFGAQVEVVTHVLLDESVAVMAAARCSWNIQIGDASCSCARTWV